MQNSTKPCRAIYCYTNRAALSFKTVVLLLVTLLSSIVSYATAWVTTAAGNATSLSSWTNGSTSPTSFTTPGDIWTISHAMTLPSSGYTWTLGSSGGAPVALIIASGGSLGLSGTTPSGTVTIYGDVTINGGVFSFTATSGWQDVNIHGNLTMNGGRFAQSGNTTTRKVVIDGNLTMNAGTIASAGTIPKFNMTILGNASITGDSLVTKGMKMIVQGNYTFNSGYASASGPDSLIVNGDFAMNSGITKSTNSFVEVSGDATITCDTIRSQAVKMIVHGDYTFNGGQLKKDNNNDSTFIYGNCLINNCVVSITGNSPNIVYKVNGDVNISASTVSGSGNSPTFNMLALGNVVTSASTYNLSGTVPSIRFTSADFSMTSGSFFVSATAPTIDLKVNGNYTMSGGTMGVSGTGGSVKGLIYGNCLISGAAAMTNTSSGNNEIHLALPASSGAMFIANTSTGAWSKTRFQVDTACIAQLANHFSTSTGTAVTHGLRVDGKLICPASFTVDGWGAFALNGLGTLEIANSGGVNGNITTTGPKTFSAAANYVFNGTTAQVTGSLLPVSLTTPGLLVIDNNAGVTLSQNTATTSTLSFVSGVLHTSGYSITTPGLPGAVTGAGATSYVEGTLKKTISGLSTAVYEVGDVTYAPMSLSFSSAASSGSLAVRCSGGPHPAFGSSGMLVSNMVNYYWTISNYSATGPATVTPMATYNFGDIAGGSNVSFTTQRYSGGAWLSTALATSNTSSPYTSTCAGIALSSLAGDYLFGNSCGAPITGTSSICAIGGTTTLSNTVAGGTWSSADPSIATVSAAGVVTGVTAGSVVIFYSTSSCTVSVLVSVGGATITGSTSACVGSASTLSASVSGGTWISSNPAVATVSPTGVVNGVATGTANISYTVGSCSPIFVPFTVSSGATISGPGTVFAGASTLLTPSIGGGTWMSSNPIVAGVSGAGLVTGISLGTCNISYTLGSCVAVSTITVDYSYTIVSDSVYGPTDTLCNTPKFYVKVSGTSPYLYLKTCYGDGAKDSIPFTTSGTLAHAYATHAYGSSGCYTVKQVVYQGGAPKDSLLFNYHHSGCNNLRFRLYFDANGNCIKENSEIFNVAPLLVKVDSAGVPIDTLSAIAGLNYKTYGGPGTVYGFTVLPNTGFYASCPATGTLYDTIATGTGTYPLKNFGLSCSTGSAFDLAVYTGIPITAANVMQGNIYVRNNYCTPTNATVTLNYSPLYTSLYSTHPAASTSSSGTLTWNLTGLSVNSGVTSLSFKVKALAGAYLPIGSTVTEHVVVTPIVSDADTNNNKCNDTDIVTGPYDPNLVEVSPAGCFTSADTQFEYTIHFENMGNDTAHNIYVMDTLSQYLDMSSLRMEMASADMDVSVYKDGVYNIARFDFPNINLLDSSHHGLCDGALLFTIRTKPGLPDGTVIANRAGIYFDYADVVMTNTVKNTKGCPSPVGVAPSTGIDDIQIHPNPTTGKLTVSADRIMNDIQVSNLMGQTVFSATPNTNVTQMVLDNLAPGMYIIKINGAAVKRFIKE